MFPAVRIMECLHLGYEIFSFIDEDILSTGVAMGPVPFHLTGRQTDSNQLVSDISLVMCSM